MENTTLENTNYNNNTNNTNLIRCCGSINEAGFINSLDKQGFTLTKCCSERIANCIDAYASEVKFQITSQNIKIIDNGIGMTCDKLDFMCDANRENHKNDKSIGISGIGGLISSYQLSKINGKPSIVYVYTKNEEDMYLKCILPWNEIFETKKYFGKCIIQPMDENEIIEFNKERNNNSNSTGTTFKFPYTEAFENLLKEQFVPMQTDCSKLDTWWPVIFGKYKTSILLENFCNDQKIEPISLSKYDYFSLHDTEYYCGKFNHEILYLKDNGVDRYITLDPTKNNQEYIEYPKGNETKPKRVKINPKLIEKAEIINFTSGMIKDNRVFNIENPQMPSSATFYLNTYDSRFMSLDQQKDIVKDFYSKKGIYRNDQRITSVTSEGTKSSSGRANALSLIKNILHRCDLSYETFSSQENVLDLQHGVQQNKNQHQNEFSKSYMKLVQYLKDYDYDRHIKYFEDIINSSNEKKEYQKKINEIPAVPQNIEDISIKSDGETTPQELINQSEPDSKITETISIDNITKSKEFLILASKALVEYSEKKDYNKINGEEIYKKIIEFIKSN